MRTSDTTIGEKTLFSVEDMRDKSATALKKDDTFIQRASKLFAKHTIIPGEARHLMLSYQAGAKEMQDVVLKALCKDCPCRGDCLKNQEYAECDGYNNILKVFTE